MLLFPRLSFLQVWVSKTCVTVRDGWFSSFCACGDRKALQYCSQTLGRHLSLPLPFCAQANNSQEKSQKAYFLQAISRSLGGHDRHLQASARPSIPKCIKNDIEIR